MFAMLKATLKNGGVAAAMVMASSHGMAFDPLRDSFERMRAHEASPPPAACAAAVPGAPADPLVAAMVLPLRDGVWPGRAPADAPVLASFTRMLRHAPSRHVPPLPATAGTDPLIAAVVWPLLRSRHVTVAGTTPTPTR
ncbi:MAG: hypothetical protein KIT17_12140 [Rubrivivax sp.]|nr:hypothetical protein [Rubrivivax sp.]